MRTIWHNLISLRKVSIIKNTRHNSGYHWSSTPCARKLMWSQLSTSCDKALECADEAQISVEYNVPWAQMPSCSLINSGDHMSTLNASVFADNRRLDVWRHAEWSSNYFLIRLLVKKTLPASSRRSSSSCSNSINSRNHINSNLLLYDINTHILKITKIRNTHIVAKSEIQRFRCCCMLAAPIVLSIVVSCLMI